MKKLSVYQKYLIRCGIRIFIRETCTVILLVLTIGLLDIYHVKGLKIGLISYFIIGIMYGIATRRLFGVYGETK
jgi:hypothetical protein